MTLQNRVDPWGQLHAAPERGTMMGNRGGKFHRPDQTLGRRRWASTHWICCDMHFKNMKHDAMGRGYTSLFFLDEVTALAAGHRPCFFCRRKEAKAFLGERRVGEFDARLHDERIHNSLMLRRERSEPRSIGGGRPLEAPQDGAPQGEGWGDAVIVEVDGKALAVKGHNLLQWSFGGYVSSTPIPKSKIDKVLTPPSIIAILQKGYQPRWHESAYQWD